MSQKLALRMVTTLVFISLFALMILTVYLGYQGPQSSPHPLLVLVLCFIANDALGAAAVSWFIVHKRLMQGKPITW